MHISSQLYKYTVLKMCCKEF